MRSPETSGYHCLLKQRPVPNERNPRNVKVFPGVFASLQSAHYNRPVSLSARNNSNSAERISRNLKSQNRKRKCEITSVTVKYRYDSYFTKRWDSVVDAATTLQDGGPTPGSCKKRISNAPRLALRITIHSRPRRDADDHSNLPSDKVNPEATNVIYIYIYIYIYGAPILDVSRSHTTTQHSR